MFAAWTMGWDPQVHRVLVPLGARVDLRAPTRPSPPVSGQWHKRAGTSLCTCLCTQNIRERQVHFQSLD